LRWIGSHGALWSTINTDKRRGVVEFLKSIRNIEEAVHERYTMGATEVVKGLCCSVHYDSQYLDAIPHEIIEKDYGCGDPTKYINEGEVVLDLGSGTGKICYIASQIVGPGGSVIGVDFNRNMLQVARKYQKEVADKIGYHNTSFRWGKIQDLSLDLERLEGHLRERPILSTQDYLEFESYKKKLAKEKPLIADNSIDIVVSNCVLNLVQPEDKERLFKEMFRVLKRGGRVAISDIVSDEDVPQHLQNDPDLWTDCISGAFREDFFLKAFENAGFYGIKVDILNREPYRTIEGIEFRSITVMAYKGKEGPCRERNQAVIYRGPWKEVVDDDNHLLKRGLRMAVCDKTYQIYSKAPYSHDLALVPPQEEVPLSEAEDFDCNRSRLRHPRESKGMDYKETTETAPCCGPEDGC
jgi:arsenite methyltransferase